MGKAVLFWVMASGHFSCNFRFASLQTLGHTFQNFCICELGMQNCGELFEYFNLAAFLITQTNSATESSGPKR